VGAVGSPDTARIEVTVQPRDRRSRKKEPETTTATTSTSATAAVSATFNRPREMDTTTSIEAVARRVLARLPNRY
jgi:hypothetical protein